MRLRCSLLLLISVHTYLLLLLVSSGNGVAVRWSQTRFPTQASVEGAGTWVDLMEITTENSNGVISGVLSASSRTTPYLKATHFQFSIPQESTLVGIQGWIRRRDILNSNAIADNSVLFVVNHNVYTNNNQTIGNTYQAAFGTSTYSYTSNFLPSFSTSVINSDGFGYALKAIFVGDGSTPGQPEVDTMWLQVQVTMDISISSVSINDADMMGGEIFNISGIFVDPVALNFSEVANYSCQFFRSGSLVGITQATLINNATLQCVVAPVPVAGAHTVSVLINGLSTNSLPISLYDLKTKLSNGTFITTTITSMSPSQQTGFLPTSVFIDGIVFAPTSSLSCRFGTFVVPGTYISQNSMHCQTPDRITSTALVNVSVSVDGVTWTRSLWTYQFKGSQTQRISVNYPTIASQSAQSTSDYLWSRPESIIALDSRPAVMQLYIFGGRTAVLSASGFFNQSSSPRDVQNIMFTVTYRASTALFSEVSAVVSNPNTHSSPNLASSSLNSAVWTTRNFSATSGTGLWGFTPSQIFHPNFGINLSYETASSGYMEIDAISCTITTIVAFDVVSVVPSSITVGQTLTSLIVHGGWFPSPNETTIRCRVGPYGELGVTWTSNSVVTCTGLPDTLDVGTYAVVLTIGDVYTINPTSFTVYGATNGTTTAGASTTEASTAATTTSDAVKGENSNESNSTVIIIGAAVGGGVAMVLIVVIAVLLMRRRKKGSGEKGSTEGQDLELNTSSYAPMATPGSSQDTMSSNYQAVSSSPSRKSGKPSNAAGNRLTSYLNDRFVVDFKELKVDNKIGEGAFGIVHCGIWRSSQVAVKILKNMENITEKQKDEFLAEIALMQKIRPHQNVVNFLGICWDPLCIITAFYREGSLFKLLQSDKPIEFSTKLRIVRGIAAGMLHLSKENIIHKDLAARNVLLSDTLEPAVSDFGMSRLTSGEDDSILSKTEVGPIKWMAPESLRDRSFSTKSDVWAFGITCIEILSRQLIFPQYDAMQFATRVITRELQPHTAIPSDTPGPLKELVESCLKFHADDRPSFEEICGRLAGMA